MLYPPVVYSTDLSKAVVPVLVFLFVAFWFILRGGLFCVLCYFVLVFFSPFSIKITSLGEERANLSAFRTFVRFALVWFCHFPLPLSLLLFLLLFLAHLSTKCLWCDIVIGQCPSFVVHRSSFVVRRAASTIALKTYIFYIPWPMDSKLGRKHWGNL